MRKLGIRGAKILDSGLDSPKGFRLFCDSNVGLLLCDTFATTAYCSGGNALRGHSSVVAKNLRGKQTARAVLIANCADDIVQKGGRDRVTARVNYASDRLLVPASELRPLFVGNPLALPKNDAIYDSIFDCARGLLFGDSNTLQEFGANTKTCSVQFFLGDDYPCVVSGTIFVDEYSKLNRKTILLTTDVVISQELLKAVLESHVRESFGLLPYPPAPNDGCLFLSSGLAGNNKIVNRDVEFLKFSKAVEFVLFELLRTASCGENMRDSISLQVVGAKSKRIAWDTVRNAYAYFQRRNCEEESLVLGLLSAAGGAGMFSRKKLQFWISTEKGKVLLLDEGRVLYIREEILSELLNSQEILMIVDFREGNYSAYGYLNRNSQKILF